ncbi:uncharacterized protein TNCV_3959741 [Trichonephila clavipes]|nr:uncharacterized protein TNCV_3959741 [Trichonephila clavipes]
MRVCRPIYWTTHPIHRPGFDASNALRTSELNSAGAPSCWNHIRAFMLAGILCSRTLHPYLQNIFYEYAILSPTINFVVLIAVLYNLLWFINVNEQNIKKWASVISLLKEDETEQAIEEPDEIMHINRDSESKYDKSDRHETFELNCNFQMLPKELYQEN